MLDVPSTSSSFNKEQFNQLLTLLLSNSLPSTPNGYLVHLKYVPWIIDSRAFEHMTSVSNLFDSYTPCSGSEKVRITDDNFSSIVGKGLIKISKNIDLQSILHVPKLTCNLLSISKLLKDFNYRINFFDYYCLFQD